jgi:hypothetical protein
MRARVPPSRRSHPLSACDRFGGVVFFNTRARARERLLEKVLPYVKLPRGGPAAADAAAAGIAPEAGAGPTGGLRTDGEASFGGGGALVCVCVCGTPGWQR